jgi:hypothetical protein
VIAALIIVVVLLLAAAVSVGVYVALKEWGGGREERARIERETRRAEYQLHQIANDAFSQMLDVARQHGYGKGD